MKKILHLCPRNPLKFFAGIENHITNLAKYFASNKTGFDYVFFTSSKQPAPDQTLSGYPLREFKLDGPSNAYYFSNSMLRAIKKEPADLIHCHGFNNLTSFSGILAKKKNQKLVLTLNSAGASSKFRKLLWGPYIFLFRLLRNRVDKFIAVSEFEIVHFSKVLGVPKERFVNIPNGADRDLIESINPPKKKGLVVSTGRLVKNKGFENLVASFALVLKQRPDARLVIMGDGEEKKALEEQAKELGIADKVEFTGFIPRDRRKEFLTRLKEAEVFVFLSNYESLPLNVVEAVTAYMPSVVTMNSGITEFVDRGEAVGVEDPFNHSSVAEKIVMLLDNPKKFIPKKVATMSWEEVAAKVLGVYRELLEESPSHSTKQN